jgi:uncharacterized protein YdbL (DUF1318 family)
MTIPGSIGSSVKGVLSRFFNPREYATRTIIDLDQVEAIDTKLFAFNDELDDMNDMIDLLRRTVERQTSGQLSYLRKDRLFHFRATEINKSRSYRYVANVNETSAKVVSAYANKKNPKGQGYVRHHAASFRFERLADEWFLIVDRTFYFTRNGFQPHRFPEALLAGKKRLERNAAVRGQVMMWAASTCRKWKVARGVVRCGQAGADPCFRDTTAAPAFAGGAGVLVDPQ